MHAMKDRERVIETLQHQITARRRENGTLDPQARTLSVQVEERAALHGVSEAMRAQGGPQHRARANAARRRLLDTRARQSEEIGALQAELERMRLRTFPAFAPGHRALF